MNNAVIFGGCGFIGLYLTEELINLNWIIKKNSKLYVSHKWRTINQNHINLLIEKIKKLSKLIDKQSTLEA